MGTETDRDRLIQKFQGRRGQEFVEALIDELVTLQVQLSEAEATIKRLDVFSAYSERLATLNAAAATVPMVSNYEITADQFFAPEVNVYGVEYTADGKPYRWTGPETESTFLIMLERSAPLRLEADFVTGEGRNEKLPLTLLIDGRQVEHDLAEGDLTRLTATIPPRPEGSDPAVTAVTIAIRRTLKPSNEDSRQLGIGLFGLKVSEDREVGKRRRLFAAG